RPNGRAPTARAKARANLQPPKAANQQRRSRELLLLLARTSRGFEPRRAFLCGVDLRFRVDEREVTAARPQLEEIAVVRVGGVADLARRVDGDRGVPVVGVGDHLER